MSILVGNLIAASSGNILAADTAIGSGNILGADTAVGSLINVVDSAGKLPLLDLDLDFFGMCNCC